MKIFIIFFIAVLYINFANANANQCEVNVKTQHSDIIEENFVKFADVNTSTKGGMMTLAQTVANVSIQIEEFDDCSMDVVINHKKTQINYIEDLSLPQYACLFDEVRLHEHLHVDMNKHALNVLETHTRDFVASNKNVDSIIKFINNKWVELSALHVDIDTHEEYLRVTKSCNRISSILINKYK